MGTAFKYFFSPQEIGRNRPLISSQPSMRDNLINVISKRTDGSLKSKQLRPLPIIEMGYRISGGIDYLIIRSLSSNSDQLTRAYYRDTIINMTIDISSCIMNYTPMSRE